MVIHTSQLCEEVEMKRCPTCRQLFADAGLNFCRLDGNRLIRDTAPMGDAPTILFSETRISERFPWLVVDPQPTVHERVVTDELATKPMTIP